MRARKKGQTDTKRDPVFVFKPELRPASICVRFPRTPKSSLKKGISVNILNLLFVNKYLQLNFINHVAFCAPKATKSPNHNMLPKIYIHDG